LHLYLVIWFKSENIEECSFKVLSYVFNGINTEVIARYGYEKRILLNTHLNPFKGIFD
jgi:hypothetical protein